MKNLKNNRSANETTEQQSSKPFTEGKTIHRFVDQHRRLKNRLKSGNCRSKPKSEVVCGF